MSDPVPWPPPPSGTPAPPSSSIGVASGPTEDDTAIGPVPAALGWLIVWIASNITSTIALFGYLAASGYDLDSIGEAGSIPVWGTVVGLTGQWTAVAVGVVLISRMFGTGDLRADYGIRFAPIDAVGLLVGLVTQFIVVPLVYAPLRWGWPDTFSNEQLEERARSLVSDNAGLGLAALVVCVAVGAPIIEETFFRGLLQRSLQRPLHRVGAWLAVSAIFAGVHLAPVEFPGLFVAGLVFGLGVLFTNRIGFGLAAHFAFNAAAMVVLVASR